MNARIGESMLTYSGETFWPLDPRPEEVHLADIAHHLSLICRFNGALSRHYSVAQHCVHIATYIWDVTGSRDWAAWGLLHDASEAYTGDLIRPLKHMPGFAFFREVETRLMAAICEHFDLPLVEPAVVKETDRRICLTESALLRPEHLGRRRAVEMMETREGYAPLEFSIPWIAPHEAEAMFLDKARALKLAA